MKLRCCVILQVNVPNSDCQRLKFHDKVDKLNDFAVTLPFHKFPLAKKKCRVSFKDTANCDLITQFYPHFSTKSV